MPAEKSLWEATTRQLKMHHRSSELRISQLRSATHVYCPASRRTVTDPTSSGRSIGYSCRHGWRSAARNNRPVLECRLSVLAKPALRWETHSADRGDPGGKFPSLRRRSSLD